MLHFYRFETKTKAFSIMNGELHPWLYLQPGFPGSASVKTFENMSQPVAGTKLLSR